MRRSMVLFLAMLMMVPVSLMVMGEEGDRVTPNVTGVLLDSATGEGVVGKLYFVGPDGNEVAITTVSGEDGAFRLQLDPGTYVYKVDARGYEGTRGQLVVGREAVTLSIELEPVSNEPENNVFGRVISGVDRSPLMAGVYIYSDNKDVVTQLRTDREGKFSCLLRPGTYMYMVKAEGFEPMDGRFVLEEDGSARLQIVMKPIRKDEDPDKLVPVYGKIMGRDGALVEHALVTISPVIIREPRINEEPGDHIPEDGVMPLERFPEPIMLEVEGGEFKLELAPGMYEVYVEARGYQEFRSTYGIRGQERFYMEILLRPFVERPDRGASISIKYLDENSDGNPDHIHIEVDVDQDGVLEILFDYRDRNSDGNPDSMILEISEGNGELMELLMMLLSMYQFDAFDQEPVPYPDEPWCDEEWGDGSWEDMEGYEDLLRDLMDGEGFPGQDPDDASMDPSDPLDGIDSDSDLEEGDPEDEDEVVNDLGVTDAGSKDDGSGYTEMAAALLIVGALSLVLLLVLMGLSRRRRK